MDDRNRTTLIRLSLLVLLAVAGITVSVARHEADADAEVEAADAATPTRLVDDEFVRGQRWARQPLTVADPDESWLDEQLAAIGYAEGKAPSGGATGVTVWDRSAAEPGVNLAHFGHEPSAVLLDMDGRVLHRWAFDTRAHLGEGRGLDADYWVRVRALPDGTLFAVHEGQVLLKLDAESRLQWLYDGGVHHDLDLAPDGRVLVLTRRPRSSPRLHDLLGHPCSDCGRPVIDDRVTVLDPQGRELRSVSILDAFERSDFAPLLQRLRGPHGDVLHTNTLELLDGRWAHRAPAFRAGNVLISVRELDTVAVLDLEQERVVWALTGLWRAQHQPTFLDDGGLMVFDNAGADGASRVLVVDPVTQEVEWTYAGDRERPFFSAECGANQRLPGGNTLVTETDTGRAFEVDADGRIVWEYRSPFRAGPDDAYVASLFEMVRLPEDFGAAWRRRP